MVHPQPPLTLAQQSNLWAPTVWGYDLWRGQSLSLMTGQPFPLQKEFQLFLDWVGPVTGQHWLDVGTSTGNYARLLVQHGATVTALDLSSAYLSRLQRHPRLHPVQGNMEAAPFQDAVFDGVVIAGTLNETADPWQMLQESVRVLKPGGRLYLMHLLPSNTLMGQSLQKALAHGGISFVKHETIQKYLEAQGLQINQQLQCGIVSFALYTEPSV